MFSAFTGPNMHQHRWPWEEKSIGQHPWEQVVVAGKGSRVCAQLLNTITWFMPRHPDVAPLHSAMALEGKEAFPFFFNGSFATVGCWCLPSWDWTFMLSENWTSWPLVCEPHCLTRAVVQGAVPMVFIAVWVTGRNLVLLYCLNTHPIHGHCLCQRKMFSQRDQ